MRSATSRYRDGQPKQYCVAVATQEPHDEDLDLLRDRLQYLALSQTPMVFLFGSGCSLPIMPSTAELTNIFLNELSPGAKDRFNREIASAPSTNRYTLAAKLVSLTRNGHYLTRLIQEATATAVRGDQQIAGRSLTNLIESAQWNIPQSYRDFARFYSSLAPDSQRPILTTNFDPFIEIALRDVGLTPRTRTVAFDNPFPDDVLMEPGQTSVLHLHGFVDSYSLSTLQHITASRESLTDQLRRMFVGSTVVVVGYSGWPDVFMEALRRSLANRAVAPSATDLEVMWLSHGPSLIGDLYTLSTQVGFATYANIDVSDVFGGLSPMSRSIDIVAPAGWTVLPGQTIVRSNPLDFADGASPSWSDAVEGEWPLLSNAQRLLESCLNRDEPSLKGVAAIGPTGEGKSLALRQVATLLASDPKETVLWREPGAPNLPRELFQGEAAELLSCAIFVIDDADLAVEDVRFLLSLGDKSTHGPRVVIATHDRLFWGFGPAITRNFEVVVFDEVSSTDSDAIVRRWNELGLAEVTQSRPLDHVARALYAEAHAGRGSSQATLLGAVLSVRSPEGLRERVSDLLEKLFSIRVEPSSRVSLGHIFGAICVLELFAQKAGFAAGGASRRIIEVMAGITADLPFRSVLSRLGRETSITFGHRYVYSRHQVIARAVWDALGDRNGVREEIVSIVGRAGGKLRSDRSGQREDYRDAYHLGTKLEDSALSFAALKAAVEGAPMLLEPRITLLSMYRRKSNDLAPTYGAALAKHFVDFEDAMSGVRVLFNELAYVELAQNAPRLAAGFVGLALHDGSGNEIEPDQLSYALVTLTRCVRAMARQNPVDDSSTAILGYQIAATLLPTEEFERRVPPFGQVAGGSAGEPPQFHVAIGRLAQKLSPYSRLVLNEFGVPIERRTGRGTLTFGDRLSFDNLRTYAR